jgi:hypothetical protein
MNKPLSTLQVLKQCILFHKDNAFHFLRIILLPILIMAGSHCLEFLSPYTQWIDYFLSLVLGTSFSVYWYRFYFLKEGTGSLISLFRFGKREFKFLLISIPYVIGYFIISYFIALLIYCIRSALVSDINLNGNGFSFATFLVVNTVIILPFFFLLPRYFFMLPAVALDQKISFISSWRQTRSVYWPLTLSHGIVAFGIMTCLLTITQEIMFLQNEDLSFYISVIKDFLMAFIGFVEGALAIYIVSAFYKQQVKNPS